MFLAHFSNTSIIKLLKWECKELYYWYHEAIKVHNKLNPEPE